jgi:hypothetical protein
MSISPKTVALESERTTTLRKVKIYTPNDTEHHIPEHSNKYLAKNSSLRVFMPGSNIMKDPGGIYYVRLTEDTCVFAQSYSRT